jgi:uncharacterized protein
MSKPSENLTANEEAESFRQAPEFSLPERKVLLAIAHEAVANRLAGRPFPDWPRWSAASILSLTDRTYPDSDPNGHIAHGAIWAPIEAPRGVFTTLYWRAELRGCVGYVAAVRPLFQAVAETACAAAFEDSRFWPVTAEEVPELKISLSVLSQTFPIEAAQVEVGRHGLVISDGVRRGLLLPQVPVEHGWDRETFLEQTCRKAGLPLDAWKRRPVTIEAFVAEVFGDEGTSP